MTEAPPAEKKPRSKRIYVYWGVALALLLTLGLFCWLVVVPVLQVRRIVSAYPETGRSAAATVEELGGPEVAVRRVRMYLRFPAWIAPRKPEAVLILGECGEAALSDLVNALGSSDAGVRSRAAWALGLLEPEATGAVPHLVTALKDSDPEVRFFAASSLGSIGKSAADAGPALVAALSDSKEGVRRYAAIALLEIGVSTDKAVPVLVGFLGHSDRLVRLEAAIKLGKAEDPSAVVALEAALKDKDFWVRQTAAEALKKIKAAQEKKR